MNVGFTSSPQSPFYPVEKSEFRLGIFKEVKGMKVFKETNIGTAIMVVAKC